MIKPSIVTGATFAALAVIIGAFGAHGLESHVQSGELTPRDMEVYETGARYQFYHALALLLLGIIAKTFGGNKFLKVAYWLFTAGVIFFSGSLYLLSTKGVTGIEWAWLGPVTPLGGLCFIVGWILIVLNFFKVDRNKE